jgi:hypothetical protein
MWGHAKGAETPLMRAGGWPERRLFYYAERNGAKASASGGGAPRELEKECCCER